MNCLPRCYVLILSAFTLAMPSWGNVQMPRVFSNSMILQRGVAAPVWGWAEAGEKVTVHFAGQQKEATADANGKWSLKLEPLEANSKGQELKIEGNNKIAFKDVVIGDVWICSGQSNMEWSTNGSINGREEATAANYPNIRLFNVPGHTTSPFAKDRLTGGQWQVCSPGTVGGFSAVGYFFGRELHTKTDVPVGLIGTNWGGTRIEPWVAPEGFHGVKELKNISDQIKSFDCTTPTGKAFYLKYVTEMEKWLEAARASIENGIPPSNPKPVPGFNGSGHPTAIYNSMVYALAPFGLRGAIWYQGESNGGEGDEYYHKMKALIEGWRTVWNQGDDFPIYFYFVQLADFQAPNPNPAGGDGWARIREAQRKSLTIPHTGMAVITDIGAERDIHPRNKQDVGKRLAQWGLRDVHKMDVVVSGPLYKGMKVEGNKIRLSFDHVGGGLIVGAKDGLKPTMEVKDGKLGHFAIAGEDKQWHWADAAIDGETVVVSSEKVAKPAAVRYGYTINPKGANLYNKEGIPASPFRTDAW